MSWPRQSLLIALFAISAPWATADTLRVTTKQDRVANDGECSLREAVDYFNLGKPERGYMGCKAPSQDEVDNITLPAGKGPYLITNGSIRVHRELSINGEGRTGDERSTIQVVGTSRAFTLYDNAIYRAPACSTSLAGCAPVGPAAGPYDDAPRLREDSDEALAKPPADTTFEDNDYLTFLHQPRLYGTAEVPLTTYGPPIGTPVAGATTTRTTQLETSYQILITLYATRAGGGERVEVGTAFATTDGTVTDADWEIQSDPLEDGLYSFVYTQRLDTITRTVEIERNNITSAVVDRDVLTTAIALGTEGADSPVTSAIIYTKPTRRLVTLKDLELIGCATGSDCGDNVDGTYTYDHDADIGLVFDQVLTGTAGKGGVIFSNEKLLLSNVLVRDGVAQQGGAVYLAADGGAEVLQAEIRGNKADSGAAFYAEFDTLIVQRSLITDNEVTGAGAVVEVASANPPAAGGLQSTSIENVTASANRGLAFSLQDGMVINASTIVLNAGGGVDFNGQGVQVYNSIVAGNPASTSAATEAVGPFADCIDFDGAAASPSLMEHSLVIDSTPSSGCPITGTGIQTVDNVAGTNGQLIADDVSGGTCNSPYGLLCRLADFGGDTFTHLPRVLASYTDLSDSPIVNRGSLDPGSTVGACPGQDQRIRNRLALACDIGAVEVQQISAGTVVRSGGAIVHGETYNQSLADSLEDEELLAVADCPPTPPGDPAKVVAGSYNPLVPGCPWLETAPRKGRATFAAVGTDGRYYYRPGSDFHGFDRFQIHVMTTLSRLNEDPNDQSRVVTATVIVEPANGLSSSNVGGALDAAGLALLSLIGVAGLRRRRNQA